MKVEVKKIDALGRELNFEVPKERVTAELDKVYKEITKHANIKGFRVGKAPRKMIEQTHGKMAREEMLKGLIPQVYQQAIKDENIHPVDFPEIHNVDLQEDGLKFTAKIDLYPEVTIKEYKGLKVKKEKVEVTDKEIEKTLEIFQQAPGADKKEKKIELDDEFAKKMGYEKLAEFKDALKKQMEFDKQRQARMQEDDQLIEKLLKNVKLDVPQSLVKRQIYGRMEQTAKMMTQQGLKEDDIKKQFEEQKKEIEAAAEKDVRIFLTLQEIAKLEKIEVKEGEPVAYKVIEFLRNEAKWEDK